MVVFYQMPHFENVVSHECSRCYLFTLMYEEESDNEPMLANIDHKIKLNVSCICI